MNTSAAKAAVFLSFEQGKQDFEAASTVGDETDFNRKSQPDSLRIKLNLHAAHLVWLLAGGTPYRRTPLIPDLGAQRAVGRILGGARRRIQRHDPGS